MKKILIVLAVLVSLTLVACSIDPIKVVTFVTNGTNEATQYVYIDGYAERPENNPIREDYAFVDWYADEACTKVFDFENTEITKDTVIYAGYDQAFVTITSENSFTLTLPSGLREGTLEYSYDGANWTPASQSANTSVSVTDNEIAFDTYKVYFRGTGNKVVTGAVEKTWNFDTATVAVKGNILTLLDYNKYKNKNMITVGDYAFAGMFKDQSLKSVPTISTVLGYGEHAFEEMFNGCTGIKAYALAENETVPAGAETFVCKATKTDAFCQYMFKGCGIDVTLTSKQVYYIVAED